MATRVQLAAAACLVAAMAAADVSEAVKIHVGSQFPNQESNTHLLHWKTKSQSLDYQRSPVILYIFYSNKDQ